VFPDQVLSKEIRVFSNDPEREVIILRVMATSGPDISGGDFRSYDDILSPFTRGGIFSENPANEE
jgi:hypothetical protein